MLKERTTDAVVFRVQTIFVHDNFLAGFWASQNGFFGLDNNHYWNNLFCLVFACLATAHISYNHLCGVLHRLPSTVQTGYFLPGFFRLRGHGLQSIPSRFIFCALIWNVPSYEGNTRPHRRFLDYPLLFLQRRLRLRLNDCSFALAICRPSISDHL